jgi:hypothetical protein
VAGWQYKFDSPGNVDHRGFSSRFERLRSAFAVMTWSLSHAARGFLVRTMAIRPLWEARDHKASGSAGGHLPSWISRFWLRKHSWNRPPARIRRGSDSFPAVSYFVSG